ncbi:CehA/McbA family metallohydrolase [Armatimonas sp.]|uniref:CehA/McbA family metallohydrolase n=1 Tax=Armatimonas sp. TaxID=1872638 RepID=UPI003752AEA5
MASSLRTKLRIAATVLGARGFWDALAGRFLWQPLTPARPEPTRPEPTRPPFVPHSGHPPLAKGGSARNEPGWVQPGWVQNAAWLRGALHVHTCTYSDGAGTIEAVMAAAKAAGVDFVLLTDHNTMRPKADGLEEHYAGQTPFLIVGDEITVKGGAFLLALDLPGDFEFAPSQPPQVAIDAILAMGGLPLVSLPDDMKHPWDAWDAKGCEGLEALNLSTVAREHINPLSLAWLLPLWRLKGELAVLKAICTRPDASLASWDRLLAQGKKQIGLGALDAHALLKIGKKKHPIPSYENSFRAVTTHVLAETRTPKAIHTAIRAGHCYFAYDCLGEIALEFTAASPVIGGQGETRMGDDALIGAMLTAMGPETALLRLYRAGEGIVAAGKGRLSFCADKPGAYRIEAYQVGAQRGPLFLGVRPWAFTNPIYVHQPNLRHLIP